MQCFVWQSYKSMTVMTDCFICLYFSWIFLKALIFQLSGLLFVLEITYYVMMLNPIKLWPNAGTCPSPRLLCTVGEYKYWRRFIFEEESQDAQVALLYLSRRRVLSIKRKWTPEEPEALCRWYNFLTFI